MRFTPIREATLLRANTLVSQEKNKKGNKTIQTEINKMSETNEFVNKLMNKNNSELDSLLSSAEKKKKGRG